jgi:hypothetical protein
MHRFFRLLTVAVVFAAVAAIPSAASASAPFDLYFSPAPSSWGPSPDADFTLQSDNDTDVDSLAYTCSLDGAVAATCPRSNHFEDLAQGQHSFTQTATDGDVSETITRDWVIDDGVGVYLDGYPDSLTNDRWAWFGWHGIDGVERVVDHVECKYDDHDWTTCGGNDSGDIERQVFGDGEHTFSLRAVDDDDDEQSFPTTYTWTLDTVDPVVTTNLPNVVTSGDFALDISSDDPDATYACSLDEDNTACDIDFSALTDGSSHVLEVRGTDPAGNTGYFYKEFGYQVGASVAQITAHPARIKSSRGKSTFEFSTDAGATLECSVNWSNFQPCTSPMTVNEQWLDQNYSFQVRAVKNGVTQNVPDYFRWYVGDKPFDLYLSSNPDEWTTDTSALFEVNADSWESNDVAYTCSLDDSVFAACEHEFEYEELAEGPHALVVHATSKSDGGFEELSFNWQISDLPGSWFTNKPSKFTSNTATTFNWNSTGNATEWACNLDNDDWSVCDGSEYEDISGLAEGEHTFQVRASNDDFTQDPVASYTWTVDRTAPVITASVPSGPITTDPYTIPISANEEGVTVWCVLDDGDEDQIFACDSGAELSGLSRGIHTISFWGSDRADNWTDTQTYTFDWQPPVKAPDPVTPAAPIVKPTLSKPSKPKNGKFTVPYSCGDATCTLTVKFKLGKKSKSLKKLIVGKGAAKAQLKLSKSQKKWLGKKGKKKATMTVTITGASGTTSLTLKF